jgi:5-methylcytosine-specific restriction endonuclease McrA
MTIKTVFNLSKLNKSQRTFMDLAVIHQMKYTSIERMMHVERRQLKKWWEDLKDQREDLAKIRDIWYRKCKELDFWDFHKWYIESERKCFYCGISDDEIDTLINNKKIVTEKLVTRGKCLEIERRLPNLAHETVNNLIFTCFWCHNAKTDEFTDVEFRAIGKEIAGIWRQRMEREV